MPIPKWRNTSTPKATYRRNSRGDGYRGSPLAPCACVMWSRPEFVKIVLQSLDVVIESGDSQRLIRDCAGEPVLAHGGPLHLATDLTGDLIAGVRYSGNALREVERSADRALHCALDRTFRGSFTDV